MENGTYFLTATTCDRIPWFQVFSFARIMCSEMENPRSLPESQNLCWVVMPDHVHLLLEIGSIPLNKVVAQFKSRTARLLNMEIGRTGRFWNPGFFDHALRKEEDLLQLARYIVANPLRAGLVRRCGDYPFWNAVWL